MPSCKAQDLSGYFQTVGDPIDVVTGANIDWNRDFRLGGPLPLDWIRHYDSSKIHIRCALGWGHTHAYDHRLVFDVDGLRHISPVGRETGFPPLLKDGDTFANQGMVLIRVNAQTYQVLQHGKPKLEFVTLRDRPEAPLSRVVQGPHAIAFSYGADGQLQRIHDSHARSIAAEVDREGRLLSLVLLKRKPEKDRPLLACRYDRTGNLIEFTDPYRHSFSFRYDDNKRMVAQTDRRGYTFRYEYDKAGRCVWSSGEDGIYEVRLEYRPEERVTVVIKADGGKWTYFYNQSNIITLILDPYRAPTKFELDEKGRIVKEVDPNGNASRLVYDSAGGLIGKVTLLGDFIALPADPNTPHPRAHRIPDCPLQWEYGDLVDRKQLKIPDVNDTVLYQIPYPAREFIRTEPLRDPAAPTIVPGASTAPDGGRDRAPDGRSYDELGLLIGERKSDAKERRWTYDASGNNIRYQDHDGSAYNIEFTSWNRRSRVTDPLANPVTYRHTASGRIAAVVDPNGTLHEYAYDQKDRLTQVRRHGVIKEEYKHDQADNLVEKRSGNGEVLLSFKIGSGNLKTVRRLASGENHHFEYDRRGRFVRVATDDLEVCFSYDDFGNRVQELRDGQGVRHRFAGRKLVETTVFDRFTTLYRHWHDGTVEILDPGGRIQTVRVIEHGLILRSLSNNMTEVAQFDADGRCLAKLALRSGSLLPSWVRRFTYSAEGDLLRTEDSQGGTWNYRYDVAHRLVAARPPIGQEQLFRYDRASNLLNQPGLRDVILEEGNRLTWANGECFEFNNRNDVSRRTGLDGVTSFFYDSRDNLTRIESVRGIWQASYDPLARRIRKSYARRRIDYYWDMDRPAAEIDQSGRVRLYVYADSFAFVPLLFMEYDSVDADPGSGRRYFLWCSQIGAPVRIDDDLGNTVWCARIDPYGAAHVDPSSTIDCPLRFPGHYFDEETGLHYNRFRYYSPVLGRYMQSDPLGIGGSLNLYAYPASPLTRVDLRGETDPPCPPAPPPPPANSDKKDEESTDHPNPGANKPLPKVAEADKLLGTSDKVGDFTNIRGLSAEEVLSRVPAGATGRDLDPVPGHAQEGVEYKWTTTNSDGTTTTNRVRVHDADPGAPPGSNAASGPVARVQGGKKYADNDGNVHPPGIGNPKSPHYNENAVNDTHIPIQDNSNLNPKGNS